jgi:hypothetical protein
MLISALYLNYTLGSARIQLITTFDVGGFAFIRVSAGFSNSNLRHFKTFLIPP